MVTRQRLLTTGALIVGACLAAAACKEGPNAPATTSTTTSTAPATTSTTSVSTTSVATTSIRSGQITEFYGTFNITATKVQDTGCNFQQTFTGRLDLSGQSDGTGLTMRMIERLTRQYTGSIAPSGAYTVAGSGNLDGFQYTGTITGTATPTSIGGTEALVFTSGCAGRVVTYSFTGTR